jgi:hypothetical protein
MCADRIGAILLHDLFIEKSYPAKTPTTDYSLYLLALHMHL